MLVPFHATRQRCCSRCRLHCRHVHAADEGEVRLYTFDCGRITIKDMGAFSDTANTTASRKSWPRPAFLIRDPKGTLLWDTGLGDGLADKAGGVDNSMAHLQVDHTLASQLETLGVKPSDITYVASRTSISITPATPTCSVLRRGSSTAPNWPGPLRRRRRSARHRMRSAATRPSKPG